MLSAESDSQVSCIPKVLPAETVPCNDEISIIANLSFIAAGSVCVSSTLIVEPSVGSTSTRLIRRVPETELDLKLMSFPVGWPIISVAEGYPPLFR